MTKNPALSYHHHHCYRFYPSNKLLATITTLAAWVRILKRFWMIFSKKITGWSNERERDLRFLWRRHCTLFLMPGNEILKKKFSKVSLGKFYFWILFLTPPTYLWHATWAYGFESLKIASWDHLKKLGTNRHCLTYWLRHTWINYWAMKGLWRPFSWTRSSKAKIWSFQNK